MKNIIVILILIFNIQPLLSFPNIVLKEIKSFGGIQSDLFYFITDMAIDENENIYITDSIDCTVKKIDKNGKVLAIVGRKGQGPGEFQFPVLIEIFDNNIYVADQNKFGISVFNKDLKYLFSIPFNFPICSFKLISNNEILVVSILSKSMPPFFRINNKGNILSGEIRNEGIQTEWWKSFGKISLDSNGDIYFISSFENCIIKCDKKYNIVWKKYIGKEKKANQKILETSVGKVALPTTMLYKDISIDNDGNIYLVSGTKEKNNSREILVLNSNGDHINSIYLPVPSYLLHIDKNNNFYAIADEGVTIKKYYYER